MSKKTRPKRQSDRKQSGRINHEPTVIQAGKTEDNSPYVFQRDKI
jgi:hypothetical protein